MDARGNAPELQYIDAPDNIRKLLALPNFRYSLENIEAVCAERGFKFNRSNTKVHFERALRSFATREDLTEIEGSKIERILTELAEETVRNQKRSAAHQQSRKRSRQMANRPTHAQTIFGNSGSVVQHQHVYGSISWGSGGARSNDNDSAGGMRESHDQKGERGGKGSQRWSQQQERPSKSVHSTAGMESEIDEESDSEAGPVKRRRGMKAVGGDATKKDKKESGAAPGPSRSDTKASGAEGGAQADPPVLQSLPCNSPLHQERRGSSVGTYQSAAESPSEQAEARLAAAEDEYEQENAALREVMENLSNPRPQRKAASARRRELLNALERAREDFSAAFDAKEARVLSVGPIRSPYKKLLNLAAAAGKPALAATAKAVKPNLPKQDSSASFSMGSRGLQPVSNAGARPQQSASKGQDAENEKESEEPVAVSVQKGRQDQQADVTLDELEEGEILTHDVEYEVAASAGAASGCNLTKTEQTIDKSIILEDEDVHAGDQAVPHSSIVQFATTSSALIVPTGLAKIVSDYPSDDDDSCDESGHHEEQSPVSRGEHAAIGEAIHLQLGENNMTLHLPPPALPLGHSGIVLAATSLLQAAQGDPPEERPASQIHSPPGPASNAALVADEQLLDVARVARSSAPSKMEAPKAADEIVGGGYGNTQDGLSGPSQDLQTDVNDPPPYDTTFWRSNELFNSSEDPSQAPPAKGSAAFVADRTSRAQDKAVGEKLPLGTATQIASVGAKTILKKTASNMGGTESGSSALGHAGFADEARSEAKGLLPPNSSTSLNNKRADDDVTNRPDNAPTAVHSAGDQLTGKTLEGNSNTQLPPPVVDDPEEKTFENTKTAELKKKHKLIRAVDGASEYVSEVGNEKKDPALDDLSSRNRVAGDLAMAGKTVVDSAAVDPHGSTANKQKRRMVPGGLSPLKEEVLEDDAATEIGASSEGGGTGSEIGLDRGASVEKGQKVAEVHFKNAETTANAAVATAAAVAIAGVATGFGQHQDGASEAAKGQAPPPNPEIDAFTPRKKLPRSPPNKLENIGPCPTASGPKTTSSDDHDPLDWSGAEGRRRKSSSSRLAAQRLIALDVAHMGYVREPKAKPRLYRTAEVIPENGAVHSTESAHAANQQKSTQITDQAPKPENSKVSLMNGQLKSAPRDAHSANHAVITKGGKGQAADCMRPKPAPQRSTKSGAAGKKG